MARYFEPEPEIEQDWKDWVASRPDNVRVVAERFEPFSLYRIRQTGQRVVVASFDVETDDSVTLKVLVPAEFNHAPFETCVFGIRPDDLEPCELPGPDEPVGATLTDPAEIEAYIDLIRPSVLANRQ
jgi:hypothetical protein